VASRSGYVVADGEVQLTIQGKIKIPVITAFHFFALAQDTNTSATNALAAST
jgi:hypothetical protein